MLARKRWRHTEPENHGPDCQWPCREDGVIDVLRFDPQSLHTPEECAAVTTELDKAIGYFGAKLKAFAGEYAATGIPTPKALYGATHKLWTLAKAKRNTVQDRRGVLRREKNNVKREDADIREERRFVEAAKRLLPREQYLAIWEAANSLEAKINHPTRESNG